MPLVYFSAQRLYDEVSFSASNYMNSHTFSSAHRISSLLSSGSRPGFSFSSESLFNSFFAICCKVLHFKMMTSSLLTIYTIIIWIGMGLDTSYMNVYDFTIILLQSIWIGMFFGLAVIWIGFFPTSQPHTPVTKVPIFSWGRSQNV